MRCGLAHRVHSGFVFSKRSSAWRSARSFDASASHAEVHLCFSGTSRDSFPVYLIGCLRPVCLQGVAAGIRFLSLLSLWPNMLCESARWGGCRGQWLFPRSTGLALLNCCRSRVGGAGYRVGVSLSTVRLALRKKIFFRSFQFAFHKISILVSFAQLATQF